jgi:hypothetical protein
VRAHFQFEEILRAGFVAAQTRLDACLSHCHRQGEAEDGAAAWIALGR